MDQDNQNLDSQQPTRSVQSPVSEAQSTSTPPVVVPPISPSQPTHEVPKPKTKTIIVLISILVISVLVSLGYWIYQKYTIKQPEPTPSLTPTSSNSSSVFGEETIIAAGFPLRIPTGWKISISSKSDTFFAGRLFIPNTDQSMTYLEIQAGSISDFIDNPTLKFAGESKNLNGLLIKTGNENLLQSRRVFYQVEKTQSKNKLQMTLFGDQAAIEKYQDVIIKILSSDSQSSIIKISSFVGLAKAQEISSPSPTNTEMISGFPKTLWKKVNVMEGPYPERISKDVNPYKGGYAKLYQFEYLIGQRIEILAEENKEDLQSGGSFIESELYNMDGKQLIKAGTRISLGVDQLSKSGMYYLLVNSYPNREGRFLLKIFDLDQVQDLYYVHYSDGSEYNSNDSTKSLTKKQAAVLIVRYTSPIEIIDNNHIRYFRKSDNACIACNSYVFGDKTIPYIFKVNNVEVPIKITKIFLNQALIQPADGEAFPENSQISFEIDYGEDPNVPGSRSGFVGGFRTY